MKSPDLAEELAPDALLARLTVGHDAARGREDRDAHSATDARDAVVADVDASSRRGDATDAVDRAVLAAAVAEHERQGLAALALALANVVEEALGLEDVGHVPLQCRV